jgi:hypothetical protein
MSDALLPYEPVIRLGAFAGIFAVMALWQLLAPRRPAEKASNEGQIMTAPMSRYLVPIALVVVAARAFLAVRSQSRSARPWP